MLIEGIINGLDILTMHTVHLRTGKLVLLYVLVQLVNKLVITVLIAGIV